MSPSKVGDQIVFDVEAKNGSVVKNVGGGYVTKVTPDGEISAWQPNAPLLPGTKVVNVRKVTK